MSNKTGVAAGFKPHNLFIRMKLRTCSLVHVLIASIEKTQLNIENTWYLSSTGTWFAVYPNLVQ